MRPASESLNTIINKVIAVRYLVALKFRTFPLSLSLSSPNELSQEFIPLDGPLAFAEYYKIKLSANSDWRARYLEDTLTSKEIEWRSEIMSSYLLPAIRKDKSIMVITPMGFKVVFSLGNKARYELSERQYPRRMESSQILLRLGRRDDILKTEILRKSLGIELTRKIKALPSPQSGPYKSIDYLIKVYTPNLMWLAIVDGVSNQKKLKELLSILKQFGIGKKRNMGWGDLLDYYIYPLDHNSKSAITPRYVVHNQKYLETWRPWSPENIAKLVKGPQKVTKYRKLSLIGSKVGYGSETPPYWKKHLVIKYALFQVS